MKRPVFLLLSLLFFGISPAAETRSDSVHTYDPNPGHLWNRLHQALFIRVAPDGSVHGEDRLDPLFWGTTRHLLDAPSHRRALEALDEFLTKHGEKLINGPLRRSFLQHDLWALFDWSASPGHARQYTREKTELQLRLAQAIHRLALTSEELKSLSDNYARAVATNASASLPRGLFLRDGEWVNVTVGSQAAPRHAVHFGGRSTFHVLVRLPTGRAATLEYLNQLRAFERPWIYAESPEPHFRMNPSMPEFPEGTEWALVRRMRVIDADGSIRPTPIIESIEVRRYIGVRQEWRVDPQEASTYAQRTSAFVASRIDAGDLREIQSGERDFYQFQAHDTDPFELSAEVLAQYPEPDPFRNRLQRDVLRSCSQCHGGRGPGIRSVQSLAQIAQDGLLLAAQLSEVDPEQVLSEPVYSRSYEWGLLRGFWAATDSIPRDATERTTPRSR